MTFQYTFLQKLYNNNIINSLSDNSTGHNLQASVQNTLNNHLGCTVHRPQFACMLEHLPREQCSPMEATTWGLSSQGLIVFSQHGLDVGQHFKTEIYQQME